MFKNNPPVFIDFCFFQHTFSVATTVFCRKHYKTSIFRRIQLSKNTVSKSHFFTHPQKHLFQKKMSFLVLGSFCWNHNFIVFPGFHWFGPKQFLAKTDSVHKHARFSPFLTHIVSGNFAKINIFFWMATFNTILSGFRASFPFSFFLFLFLLQQHKKDKNKKCYFLFASLIFDIPTIQRKHYFGTNQKLLTR